LIKKSLITIGKRKKRNLKQKLQKQLLKKSDSDQILMIMTLTLR